MYTLRRIVSLMLLFVLFQGGNILGYVFEKLVTIMIIYFVLSIVNSLAQSYAKRIDEQSRKTSNNDSKSK